MSQKKHTARPSVRTVPATYFDVQAYWGATKHMGGRRATDELIGLCGIDADSLVLEIGCGVGVTTSMLAGRIGCRVVALDRNLMMLSRAGERARREGDDVRVMFVCADARHIPFREGVFDVVMSESATTFVSEKREAVRDYVRATVPGGRVGVNEEIWHEPPNESMASYVEDVLEIPSGIPDADGWITLLRDAGLSNIVARPRHFRIIGQFLDELGRYRFGEYLLSLGRFFALVVTNRAFRRYMRHTMFRAVPRGMFRRLGYGLFVGVKGDDAARQGG
ncbi:MAG: class I SAM-dependent methyltransferase [Deltaproteobacteria bacterium]|nr:class I SAM-dependent methyltransferase [Candidatus Zymogenaceae bacterium]